MKPNPPVLLLGTFLALVAAGGALLLSKDKSPSALSAPAAAAPVADKDFAVDAKTPASPVPAPTPRDERFVIKRILPITGPIRYGEWHWDAKGVPAGPLVVTVDLDARVLSVFQGGYEIGATAVLLGTSEKPTPLGVFPVKWKDKDHYSSTYDRAPMPFTMNLTVDGVAIHGTKVEKGYASHGCIGVPDPFAAKLFALAPVGTKVYITRGKMVGKGDSLVEG
ncbi:MAG: L,D-transpeptidase family protein [Novosphingobium sp.]|uniref:L,D-transpeptidase family protein n=1 Tax=Novosphingobium sp. TaxID=1874826 RepID=UPI001D4DE2BD|nr:L,D-transpeptidase family protein [Novosphingobium sp.]MCB2057954.1 L,D-transpeptidase family protein [Novosphingobium sp.]MCP5385857.1 L,D-transpeptidase family protein [Novosphingobium sp.]